MKQIAKRVYNNNVVLSENASGEEIILVGKGLAFGLNKGDLINTEKIEKKFEFVSTHLITPRKFQVL